MKYILFLVISIIYFSLSGYCQVESKMYNIFLKSIYKKNVSTISCDSLYERFNEYQIIDTRSAAEYEVSHLKNAQYINFDAYELIDLTKYEKDTPILFYCSVGWRSQKVASYFMDAGFTQVYNLFGGIFEWSNKDLPLYSMKGNDTDSVHVFSKKWGVWVNKGIKVF